MGSVSMLSLLLAKILMAAFVSFGATQDVLHPCMLLISILHSTIAAQHLCASTFVPKSLAFSDQKCKPISLNTPVGV